MKQRFDKLFFTGSPHVGKIVYKAAAEHLTPVTLELGGKSPVIVTASSDLKLAARRIVWGKFLNAGQTCLAPDYVYVEESVEEKFLAEIKDQLTSGAYAHDAESYTRIINAKHFDRLEDLIDKEKLFFGGKSDKSRLYMEPTIMWNITWEDKVMEEEIFGPILPIMTYRDFDQVIEEIKAREKPLSAYLFTTKKDEEQRFLHAVSFGGGCINDSIMHFTNPNLPFGGVGNSGIGNYHGQYGLETFSHKKSILKKATWGEPNLKYPPYTESKKRWIKRIM